MPLFLFAADGGNKNGVGGKLASVGGNIAGVPGKRISGREKR